MRVHVSLFSFHVAICWCCPVAPTVWDPSVQLHVKPMCLVLHSEISLLCSKRVNLAIRWPLRWMSATLPSQGFTPMSAALPPGSPVGTRRGSHQGSTPPPFRSYVWSSHLKCHQAANHLIFKSLTQASPSSTMTPGLTPSCRYTTQIFHTFCWGV